MWREQNVHTPLYSADSNLVRCSPDDPFPLRFASGLIINAQNVMKQSRIRGFGYDATTLR